jgi:hypothetical protein
MKESVMLRRFIIGTATVAALGMSFCATDAFAAWRHGGGGHGGGWHGGRGYVGSGGWGSAWGGSAYYGLPYFGYPYAYPGPYYPGYIPENATYCDPNSGTYIDEDGARHLCR